MDNNNINLEEKNVQGEENFTHDQGQREPFVLKEESQSDLGKYGVWGIIILILLALIWYGYSAGWFSFLGKKSSPSQGEKQRVEKQIPQQKVQLQSINVQTSNGFPVEKSLLVKGILPNGCTQIASPQVRRDGNVFYVTLATEKTNGDCSLSGIPFEEEIFIPVYNLPAGDYIVVIAGKEIPFSLEKDNFIDYQTGDK